MRHDAMRIVHGDLRKLFFRLFVPEGVQQRYSTLEGLLHIGRAGNGEVYRAQLRGGQVFMVRVGLIVVGDGTTSQNSKDEKNGKVQRPQDAFHSKTPLRSEFSRATGKGQTVRIGGLFVLLVTLSIIFAISATLRRNRTWVASRAPGRAFLTPANDRGKKNSRGSRIYPARGE